MEDKKCPICGTYDEFLTIDFFELDEGVEVEIKQCIICEWVKTIFYGENIDNLEEF